MEDYASLDLVQDGQVAVKLCMDVTLYWRGTVFDRRDGILSFYKRSIEELQGRLKFYETGTMAGAKPLRKDTFEMLGTWLKAKPRRDIYMINLESGEHRNEPSDGNFSFAADEDDDEPVGAIRLILPVGVADAPDLYIEKVRNLVEGLDFESGHASFALNWDSRGDMTTEAMQHMKMIASRYLGVDIFEWDVTFVALRQKRPFGIKSIGWLTLLGQGLSGALGGASEIEKVLSPECRVYSEPWGVLIRAGEHPRLGDRNRGIDLPEYRKVGRLLSAFRLVDHKPIVGSEDFTRSWLARFDE